MMSLIKNWVNLGIFVKRLIVCKSIRFKEGMESILCKIVRWEMEALADFWTIQWLIQIKFKKRKITEKVEPFLCKIIFWTSRLILHRNGSTRSVILFSHILEKLANVFPKLPESQLELSLMFIFRFWTSIFVLRDWFYIEMVLLIQLSFFS